MIDTGLLVVLKGNLKKTRTKKNQKNDQHKALSSAHSELKKIRTKRSKPNIDTGLLVVLTINFTMLLCVLILLSYDFKVRNRYTSLFSSWATN